jgi:hypothetical protein
MINLKFVLSECTEEEVKKALFAIGDFKAPGTDGMHAIFKKKLALDWWICDKGSVGGAEYGYYTQWLE